MTSIKVSVDKENFSSKPEGADAARISVRIGSEENMLKYPDDFIKFAHCVSTKGNTFCTATFKDGRKCKENFEQQQMFALDFDNKDDEHRVSFEDVKMRAGYYDLHIFFAYETLSSTNKNKFRIVFINDVPITDRIVAETMQSALSEIFPEADKSCIKDVSKMYYGGKNELYIDKTIPEIDIETLFRSLTYCYHNTRGAKHYKEAMRKFSTKTGIALGNTGLFDVSKTDEDYANLHLTENKQGASDIETIKNGGNSPSAIIYNYIKGRGENPPIFYQVKFNNSSGTVSFSVSRSSAESSAANHKDYRSSVIDELPRCRLFREFLSGDRKLTHDEVFHICNNMINIETGYTKFISVLEDYPEFYGDKLDKWKKDADYNRKQNYYPSKCDNFCPYRESCSHGKNILTTVHPKGNTMERIDGYREQFYPLNEAEIDNYHAIRNAVLSDDDAIYVIKAQTAIGKSTSFLKIILEQPEQRFIIAAPTNILKNELAEKARSMRINVMATPSLDEIMDELPDEVQYKIQKYYARGQSDRVHEYIKKILKKHNIKPLNRYMRERHKLMKFNGSIVTTHRYLLSMDEERLSKFDCIIIDEDIIFKTIVSSQFEISKSNLKNLKYSTDKCVAEKAKNILEQSEYSKCIFSKGFEWSYEGHESLKHLGIDIPALCRAEHFYFRSASEEKNLDEDVFSFVKPTTFHNGKFVIVSATADEDIYQSYFRDRTVNFYECKQAQYKGELRQYYKKSMSRCCIDNNPEIIDTLSDRLGIEHSHIITFKNQNIGSLHFGNAEGSNRFEGENIMVVGTPYYTDFLYKLTAFFLDMDFDEDEEISKHIIEHNGYQTNFTTFENINLRKIHFWMLESELEQAVGRARLLRKDCTVHLFSNFPLSQAKMIDDFDY